MESTKANLTQDERERLLSIPVNYVIGGALRRPYHTDMVGSTPVHVYPIYRELPPGRELDIPKDSLFRRAFPGCDRWVLYAILAFFIGSAVYSMLRDSGAWAKLLPIIW